jgi:hypothetical protein
MKPTPNTREKKYKCEKCRKVLRFGKNKGMFQTGTSKYGVVRPYGKSVRLCYPIATWCSRKCYNARLK